MHDLTEVINPIDRESFKTWTGVTNLFFSIAVIWRKLTRRNDQSHREEYLDIINYSSTLKREIWMHSRLEKPIIREERAETSSAAFIKFGFSIARGKNWETQERVFEEEGLILNLSLKRGSLRKYKDYSWAFENDEKTDIFGMSTDFKSDFSITQTGFQIPKSGKWKMDLFWNRTRFNLENWWTTTTISRSFKITSRAKFKKNFEIEAI